MAALRLCCSKLLLRTNCTAPASPLQPPAARLTTNSASDTVSNVVDVSVVTQARNVHVFLGPQGRVTFHMNTYALPALML